ncbi:hypothetical protein L9F63_015618, partial [Diploptera punctata]
PTLPKMTFTVLLKQRLCHTKQISSIYQSRYNNKEEDEILQVINNYSSDELSRFDITRSRITNLQRFRRKRGPFSTLSEILEVDGLGVKVLERLCDSILKYSSQEYDIHDESEIVKHLKALNRKSKIQVVTPPINHEQLTKMKTAVGVHIGGSAVTWTHMDQSGNVLDWNIYNLEFESKRPHVTDLFEVAKEISNNIGIGDIYVLEDKGVSSVSPIQQPASIRVNLQNFQLSAILLALLNVTHQKEKVEPVMEHAVYFLRSQLPARLFKSIVGSERVSAQSIVLDIISQNTESYDCSDVNISDKLKEMYLNRASMEKENLCWSLLLIMTFMDIVVHRNPNSLQILKNVRKNKCT